jgi:hypothetical protein
LLNLANALWGQTSLTLLNTGAKDGGERVLAGFGWWGNHHLHFHELRPGGVSLHAECLDSIGDACVDLSHLRVELRDHHQRGDDGGDGGSSGQTDEDLRFLHFCF